MKMFCYNCNEDSIVEKSYTRKSDGVRVYFEYCTNKNPSCQYKFSREIIKKDKKK